MAYDTHLAERVNSSLTRKQIVFEEKKMFGGVAFMVDEKMCLGVYKESLMVRTGAEQHEKVLKKKGCRIMTFTGRPMKGIVLVDPEGIDKEKDFDYWIGLALAYNKIAKTSKKKSEIRNKK